MNEKPSQGAAIAIPFKYAYVEGILLVTDLEGKPVLACKHSCKHCYGRGYEGRYSGTTEVIVCRSLEKQLRKLSSQTLKKELPSVQKENAPGQPSRIISVPSIWTP